MVWLALARGFLYGSGVDRLMSLAEVAAHLDVTPSRVSQIAKRPSFPEPVRTIGRVRLWDRRAIIAWAKTWDRGFQGGRGRAAG